MNKEMEPNNNFEVRNIHRKQLIAQGMRLLANTYVKNSENARLLQEMIRFLENEHDEDKSY